MPGHGQRVGVGELSPSSALPLLSKATTFMFVVPTSAPIRIGSPFIGWRGLSRSGCRSYSRRCLLASLLIILSMATCGSLRADREPPLQVVLDSQLGDRLCCGAALVDDVAQGADHAARVAALPDVASEDDAGGARLCGVGDDLQCLLGGLHPGAAGDQDRHKAVVRHLAEVFGVIGLDEV